MNDFVIGEAGLALLKMKDEIASSVESVLIAKQIKQALIAKNWTKAELARQLDVKPSMVTKYLRGSENFTLMAKHKLQRVLGVKLGELALENENLNKEIENLKESLNTIRHKESLAHIEGNSRTNHLSPSFHISNNASQTLNNGITGFYKSINSKSNKYSPSKNEGSHQEIA